MSTTLALGPAFLDPERILETLGPWALWGAVAIIFAECGLLIGFFLPGDSLLFITGMFVSQGFIHLDPVWVCLFLTIAAIVGNLVGYGIGYRAGPAIFKRDDSRLFKASHVARTHAFFEKHGVQAIVLARFVPIVRTFITVVAGVGRMPFRTYAIFSTLGALLWATGVTVLGYFLGQVAFIRDNVEVILIVVVLVSVIPIGIEALRHRRRAAL